jgi:ribosomal peptide maturation radical SAM protein 1
LNKKIFKNRIALISPPWPVFNRPSIQLGTLKAYVKKQIPELEIVAYHFYLQLAESIGYDIYKVLSERTWIAESVYAALLYPENFVRIEKFFHKQSRGKSEIGNLTFDRLVQKVEHISKRFISENYWSGFGLVGFSVCLCQLTSSLYFMRQIKVMCPEMVIVAGGSLIAASSAKAMLQAFPRIDAIIVGEGEKPLAGLLEHLRKTNSLTNLPIIDGVVIRQSDQGSVCFSQTPSLSEIPPPDYQEYFDMLKKFAPEKRFFPVLPAEISRGCWWRSKSGPKGEKGCTFCNLNLQWNGYRTKKTQQVVSEIDAMTSRYGLLSVSFMDNVIPPKQTVPIFNALSSLKKDFHLFCELRASVGENELRILRQAGVEEVQVGIEALSTSLLKKMNKGVTAIQNIEIMKHCEGLSIKDISNLLICFPGSDKQDVAQTLEAISFLHPFRPLKIVFFWLGLESPVYRNYKNFGLRAVFNHPNYRMLFPPKIADNIEFLIQDYTGDKVRQKKLWRPVIDAVSAWKKAYEKLHEKPSAGPILSYRDGREFMIIRERRINGEPQNHRLTGSSRTIYLFCNHTRSIDDIIEKFPSLDKEKLLAFLKMMTQKKLMFQENGEFLSLAVPERKCGYA